MTGSTASVERRGLYLALGSGGVRGFAHLGVLKTFLDAGLSIDGISGVSTGALFGALYAIDGRIESVLEALNASPLEIAGFYRDRLRLAGSNRLGVRIAERFGDSRIESLHVPLSIVTVDLETGEEVVLREGELLPAVAASIAIPVLARPVEVNGRPLIDGGYGTSGASAAARSMHFASHGPASENAVVVEVNLGVRGRLPRVARNLARGTLARLRSGRARFARARRAALGLGTLMVGEAEKPLGHADLIISPILNSVVVRSPFAPAEAFRRGEEAALAALPQLRELLSSSA
jgi:predicted acylesterase/phospholipase RssA